jgi:polyphosphate kinase
MQLNLKSAQGKLIRKLLRASKVGVELFFLIRCGFTFVCCLKTVQEDAIFHNHMM